MAKPIVLVLAATLTILSTLGYVAPSSLGEAQAATTAVRPSPTILSADPSAAAKQNGDRFGIVDAYRAPELARRTGAAWERLIFFWDSIQPDSPDQWKPNPNVSDQQIDSELAAGMTLVGLIGNPPAWATRNGSVPKNITAPLDSPDNYWARFVSTLVGRYAGKIDAWVIWNEPDIDPGKQGSTWGGYEEEYYQLLKTAYLSAKRVNPKAKIVFAGTTYWADVLAGRKLFLERILERAVLDPSSKDNNYYFDVVDVHIYSAPEQFLTIPAAYRDVLRRYQTSKPIWVSETNVVPCDDPIAKLPRSGYRASMNEQASFVIQMMALSLVADIQRVAFYKMVDGTIERNEPFGLVRNDQSLRPAYSAFQAAVTYLTRPGGITHKVEKAIETVTIEGDTYKTTVMWNKSPNATKVAIRPTGTRAKVISKTGVETVLSLPTDPRKPYYEFPLPGATANTADGEPNRYIIGGDPVILVEEGIGEGIRTSPQRLFYPTTGFSVSNAYLNYFERRGGLRTFGYPVSRPLKLLGDNVQFFQRQVMWLRADGNVGTLNVLDEGYMPFTQINQATLPGIDPALTKQAPSPGDPDYGKAALDFVLRNAPNEWNGLNVNFTKTFSETVLGTEAYPDGDIPYELIPGLNLELWGLPTSAPAFDPRNANAVYLRFQRGVMHYDKTTGRTQGMLLAQYLKAILTGDQLPPDLDSQAKGSRFYKQYDPTKPAGIARPAQLPDSVLSNAFEPEAATP